MHPSSIKYYVNLFLDHGPEVFTNEEGPKTYSREYRISLVAVDVRDIQTP